MHISKEGITDKLMEKLGGKYILTGDNEFDKQFRIKRSSETDIQSILDPSLRQEIFSLGKHP